MSDDADLHELNRTIGGLQNAVETLTRTWAAQDLAATAARRELYREVNALRVEVAELHHQESALAAISSRLDAQGIRLDRLDAAHNQALGAAWLARLGFAGLGGAVGALLTKFGLK